MAAKLSEDKKREGREGKGMERKGKKEVDLNLKKRKKRKQKRNGKTARGEGKYQSKVGKGNPSLF